VKYILSLIRPSRGFTLIEVLASVVIVGLLATALVPLQMKARQRQLRIIESQLAYGILQELILTRGFRPGPRDEPLKYHPEWTFEMVPLSQELAQSAQRTSYRWYCMQVRRRTDKAILAQSLAAWPRPAGSTP
jgi:prepilin-type N-terminal cleavage/methylation domain-containing protein